jgi:demethoxyubiquinone hydroxylase (CLK1/Coq7/Cat5 family)
MFALDKQPRRLTEANFEPALTARQEARSDRTVKINQANEIVAKRAWGMKQKVNRVAVGRMYLPQHQRRARSSINYFTSTTTALRRSTRIPGALSFLEFGFSEKSQPTCPSP